MYPQGFLLQVDGAALDEQGSMQPSHSSEALGEVTSLSLSKDVTSLSDFCSVTEGANRTKSRKVSGLTELEDHPGSYLTFNFRIDQHYNLFR